MKAEGKSGVRSEKEEKNLSRAHDDSSFLLPPSDLSSSTFPRPRRDLRERTYKFAGRIIRLFSELPKNTPAQVLGRQLLRSGTSVGANYREASRGRSKPEFISKIGECLREADESIYWLELLESEHFLPRSKSEPLLTELNEFVSISVAILKRAKGE